MSSYTAPAPSKKDSVYWDYWWEMVKSSVYRETKELPAIIEATQLKGKHVIEVGCGAGRLILPFSKLTETITAVDESDWTIKVTQRVVEENNLEDRVQVVQSPLVSMPFDDGVSDSTYCIWNIHHGNSRWQKIVKEMVRITKPNSPIVVGFASGEKDLPLLESCLKPGHAEKAKKFDQDFPAWCKEQEWLVDVRKVPLAFEFKSPEWAFEVFSNTFFPRHATVEQHTAAREFLAKKVKNGKCVIEQEMRLYVIRAP